MPSRAVIGQKTALSWSPTDCLSAGKLRERDQGRQPSGGIRMSTSQELLEHYRSTHETRVYGTSSVKYLRFLRPWIRACAPRSIIDFGCGQSRFLDALDLGPDVALHRYDPAIPAYDALPTQPVDLLINIDVLEHIPEADLDDVMGQMASLAPRALLVIDTKPSNHTLADGRNAHVTLHDHAWWQARVARIFGHAAPISTTRRSRAGFRTWAATPAERALVARSRFAEDARHLWLRAQGRHKELWKVSTTHGD